MITKQQLKHHYRNQWESTGNLCIDAVATAITEERINARAPKRIDVTKYYWDKAMMWFSQLVKDGKMNVEDLHNIEVSGMFTLDGVEVCKSVLLVASKPMSIEYYRAHATD